MPIARLRIESFRCLNHVELELGEERSYVFGPNGAGKTSLLEAIHFLGRGRSFRTRESRRLVQWGASGFSVYAETRDGQLTHRVGVSFGAEGITRRLDGAPAAGMAEVAAWMPVHVLDPGAHELIEGAPRVRRRFLDWGVFHVEHGYLDTWRRYRRALGQRNAALKSGQGASTVAPWTQTLVECGTAIDAARRTYVAGLQAPLAAFAQSLLGMRVEATYQRGWRAELTLEEALREAEQRERLAGATLVGPHRGDLSVRLATRGVRDDASRGQQKLVATCMVLSQIELASSAGRAGTLLVDDPGAELDAYRLAALLETLASTPAQLVITGLAREQLKPAAGFPVFHVEQGKVAQVV